MRVPVDTQSGQVRGGPGRDGAVTVYRGIPYAAAPAGELRWRPPRPPAPWPGVRDATRYGPMCPQSPEDAATAGVGLPLSEDCLNLNVWTPAASAEERLPVLVWIYGGGFRMGTGASPRYDGENLARRGLVVVTFNYRLGALGFLATPGLSQEDKHQVSGNYGLLDTIAALGWVRRNIAGFGGDPDRVTIAGQSAGAGTVHFLAMSPLARGLFQRAIAQSHARYSRDPELRYLATSYRRLVDAEAAGARYAARFGARSPAELRALPWQSLVDSGADADVAVETGGPAKPPLFRPVVDGWALPAGYDETYASGAQADVWYLAGNNLDEGGAVPDATFARHREAAKAGVASRPGAPPVHVTLDAYHAAAKRRFGSLTEDFLRLYPAATDDEAARAGNAAVRDNARVSTALWGEDWARRATRPAYTYFWTHRAPSGQDHRRASHGSEIDFVFRNPDTAWTDADRRVADIMSGYWANFAATGDPNGPGLPHWAPFAPGAGTVMELGGRFGPIPVADPARIEFWRRFFLTQKAW